MTTARLQPVSAKRVTVLVCADNERFLELKEAIEFLDSDSLVVAGFEACEPSLGAGSIAAVFVDGDLANERLEHAVSTAAAIDAAVPIVVVSRDAASDGACKTKLKSSGRTVLDLECPVSLQVVDRVLREISTLQPKRGAEDEHCGDATRLIGRSVQLEEISRLIDRVAPTASTVLITGESGTGKEIVAQNIHRLSGRGGKFVAINCGAIPDQLLESELFGHERGAFTGADRMRIGRFEQADGGTLFLDEIGDMPWTLQVKLLRVLQERTIERIGGTESIPVDIRLIAATHRDLPTRIDKGLFRADLYYRLQVFPIEVPPLRERQDDIEPLLHEFARRMRRRHGVSLVFSSDAIERLRQYPWPGNIRELANLVERLTVTDSNRVVMPADLPHPIGTHGPHSSALEVESMTVLPEGGMNLKDYLSSIEKRAIRDALEKSDGVVQGAAERLGMGRTTLVEKIKRHGIEVH